MDILELMSRVRIKCKGFSWEYRLHSTEQKVECMSTEAGWWEDAVILIVVRGKISSDYLYSHLNRKQIEGVGASFL